VVLVVEEVAAVMLVVVSAVCKYQVAVVVVWEVS